MGVFGWNRLAKEDPSESAEAEPLYPDSYEAFGSKACREGSAQVTDSWIANDTQSATYQFGTEDIRTDIGQGGFIVWQNHRFRGEEKARQTVINFILDACSADEAGRTATDPSTWGSDLLYTTIPEPEDSPASSSSSVPPRSTTSAPGPSVAGPTSTPGSTLRGIVLAPDGLGLVGFGVGEQAAIDEVTRVFGPPMASEEATCPSGVDRFLTWGKLTVLVDDGIFSGYALGPIASVEAGDQTVSLVTAAGVGVGSSVEAVQEAYGNEVAIEQVGDFAPSFVVRGEGDQRLTGGLTGVGPSDAVESISAGLVCGE